MSYAYQDQGTPSMDAGFNMRDPAVDGGVLQEIMLLNAAVAATGEAVEGNVCYWHETPGQALVQHPPTRDAAHVGKRINLAVLAGRHHSALEIGLNAGHSALLLLLGNPALHLFSVDLCMHAYTRVAAAHLKARFGRRFHFLEDDSREVLPRMAVEHPRRRFDLLHVDGGHGASLAYTDISNSLRMAAQGADLVFDDVNAPHLGEVVEAFIRHGWLLPLRDTRGLVETPLHALLTVEVGVPGAM